ncbi:unnamed protein product, partial [Ectocarpus sp. 13 AM-2016]
LSRGCGILCNPQYVSNIVVCVHAAPHLLPSDIRQRRFNALVHNGAEKCAVTSVKTCSWCVAVLPFAVRLRGTRTRTATGYISTLLVSAICLHVAPVSKLSTTRSRALIAPPRRCGCNR